MADTPVSDAESLYQEAKRLTYDGFAAKRSNDDSDFVRAFDLFTEADALGHLEAKFMLACAYSDGRGTQQDKEKAFDRFLVTAEAGHVDAMVEVAAIYKDRSYEEDPVEGQPSDNAERSFQWYEKAAVAGNTQANLEVANRYYPAPDNPHSDWKRFEQYMTAAAEGGEGLAVITLALIYLEGRDGFPKDPAKALHWLLKDAEKGDGNQQLRVAKLFLDNPALDPDGGFAVHWLKTLDANSFESEPQAEGRYMLAQFYFQEAHGLPRDIPAGVALMEKAATARFPAEYDTPPGIKVSCSHDARLKCPDAAYTMGLMRYFGFGVAKDEAKAYRYFFEAATSLHDQAAFMVHVAQQVDKRAFPIADLPENLRENLEAKLALTAQNFGSVPPVVPSYMGRPPEVLPEVLSIFRNTLLEQERGKIGALFAVPDKPSQRQGKPPAFVN